MGNPKGVRRDFEALEKRRLQAARLFAKGCSQAEVARQTGVSRESARRWHGDWQRRGKQGLKKAGRAGRKPRLNTEQLATLRRGLTEGPEVLGYGTGLWTTPRVADLIERQTGQKYHPGHVWRILRCLGWSCQRPTGRATQRDEPAIQRWKQVRWPEIKKKPGRSAAPSSLSTKAV
jgi:transposase